ncbi:MAG TPA: YebC/PmpR family DNA-binding transcriptional regulator [Bacteroidaceae bacterium]|nr:YebC/PmpR family DNA-binding transcriptional regulator [Bacteroidaceae bacterium]
MGRAFEFRKARKMKRWANMARTFTRIGKQISIAVKAGGPDPETNPALRAIIATAKHENMPKDNIERAIKNALGKDQKDYKEMSYEGYGPYGVAIYTETLTDNTTRTVANVRSVFNKYGGTLGTTGSLDFIFAHKCQFTISQKEGIDIEDLIFELIDLGVEDEYDFDEEEKEITLYGDPKSYAMIQKYLEENDFEVKAAEFTRIPNDLKDVSQEQREIIDKIVDRLEEDEDVQNVYTNMSPIAEE